MYKMLFFLHKGNDESVEEFFESNIVTKLRDITGKNIITAKVESNLLLEQKFGLFCEISAQSKDDLDKMMHSKAGKELNKLMMNFHQNITVIEVNYDRKE